MSSPQFDLYSHTGGGFVIPKALHSIEREGLTDDRTVAMVLKALGLSYKTTFYDFQKGEQKSEEHTKLNPNGRIPTIVDHGNNDFTLWESNAILKYLVSKYDKKGELTVSGAENEAKLDQWLYFQASGQGPYFGQAAWFKLFAPEKIPYAVERYQNEISRVLGVLDGVLAKQSWLAGDKVTIADISFVPWNAFAFAALLADGKKISDWPNVEKWHNKLTALPYVKEALDEKAAASK